MTVQEIGCFPELPEGPYPPNVNMREVGSRGPGGRIAMLGYDDTWGEREYLYTFTDLCDRAGCHCLGDRVVCHHWGILFVPVFYQWYKDQCLAVCECFEEDPDLLLSNTTMESASSSSSDTGSTATSVNNYKLDWALDNAQKMRQVYSPSAVTNSLPNGRSIEDSALPASSSLPSRLNGGKPCLAGQAAGWTFQKYARGRCCPGYAFSELTASEAYVNYGLPIGNIVAGIWIVGMCLKSQPG